MDMEFNYKFVYEKKSLAALLMLFLVNFEKVSMCFFMLTGSEV